MKIGILTGGGDVPGLNACIKAVVNRASEDGHSVIGIRRGWRGLLNYIPTDENSEAQWLTPLNKQVVRTIDRTGGTFLHTSRINPSRVSPDDIPHGLRGEDWGMEQGVSDFTPHILKNIESLGLDAIVVIGGHDSLHYANRLHTEGVSIVAIPKTMDNDVYGTDYCIGFSTAITRSVDFIHNLRTATGSHERIGIVELFGRQSGETSLISAYLSGVDRAIISEVPFDPEKLASLIVQDKNANPSNYAIMTISEGSTMIGGVKYGWDGNTKLGGIGAITGEVLKKISGQNIVYQQVAYLMRSGAPDSIDLMVSLNYAHLAMDLLNKKESGRMVALKDGKYNHVPVGILVQGVKRVDVDEFYDVDCYKPKVRYVNDKPLFLY